MSTALTQIHECPQCGAPAQLNSNVCLYCRSEFIVKSFQGLSNLDKGGIDKYIASYKKAAAADPDNSEINAAMGMCYLKLGLYDFALKHFQKAMQDMIENGDVYFYGAICHLKGKRPFLSPLTTIRKAEELLEAAISLEPGDGKYYYAHALIKYDYYYKKRLNTSPNFKDLLQKSDSLMLNNADRALIDGYMATSF